MKILFILLVTLYSLGILAEPVPVPTPTTVTVRRALAALTIVLAIIVTLACFGFLSRLPDCLL